MSICRTTFFWHHSWVFEASWSTPTVSGKRTRWTYVAPVVFWCPMVRSATTPPRGHSLKVLQLWRCWFCSQDSLSLLESLDGFQVVLSWAVLVQEALIQRKRPFQVPYKALRKVKVGNCVDMLSVKRSQMPVAAVACCAFLYLIASCRMGSLD